MTPSLDELSAIRGAPVYAADDEKIGKVEEIFLDDDTQRPEWIGIGSGVFKSKHVLVPVAGAEVIPDGVRVPYPKDQIGATPDIDADHIDQQTEQALYSHYGFEYGERRSDSGLPEGAPTAGASEQGEVTRSEEELTLGKERVSAGTVRLRKWVETEPVSTEVSLQKERARVEREPINEPVSDSAIGEEEVEVPLTAEQAVVDKQTVAKERISLDKDVTTDTETVSDELRKEQIDLDGENVRRD
jgi:uncharacterized protein (TIGR02271 family)